MKAPRIESDRKVYCYPQCRDPFFNECADCWQSGGNPPIQPAPRIERAASAYVNDYEESYAEPEDQ